MTDPLTDPFTIQHRAEKHGGATEGWYWPATRRVGPISRGAHTCHYAILTPNQVELRHAWSLCSEWPYMGEPFRIEMGKIPPEDVPGPRCRKCIKALKKKERKPT